MAATPIESICMPHQCDGALIGVRSMQLPPGRVLSKQVRSFMGPSQRCCLPQAVPEVSLVFGPRRRYCLQSLLQRWLWQAPEQGCVMPLQPCRKGLHHLLLKVVCGSARAVCIVLVMHDSKQALEQGRVMLQQPCRQGLHQSQFKPVCMSAGAVCIVVCSSCMT